MIVSVRLAVVLLLGLAAAPALANDDPVRLRVPRDASGRVDLAALVVAIEEKADLDLPRPAERLLLPVDGLAGALAQTLIREGLGPEANVEITPEELVLSLPAGQFGPEEIDTLRARVQNLAAEVRLEARRRVRYGLHARPSYRPGDPGRPTICLVHGLNSSSGSFVHLVPGLEEAGFGVVLYDFPDNRDLDETAPQFARELAEFRKARGDDRPWSIVTHSMGGLVARHYVEGPEYGGDIAHLVLVAPPNYGSALAGAQFVMQLVESVQAPSGRRKVGALAGLSDGLGEAASDMVPGCAFLRSLNERPRREGVGYHILAGDEGFLTASGRRKVEARAKIAAATPGLLGKVAAAALVDLDAQLDALTDGTGDGCVPLDSTRLPGVEDHITLHANHVALIRGPLLFPEPGPVMALPYILRWLGEPAATTAR